MNKKFLFGSIVVLAAIAATMIYGSTEKHSSTIPFDAKAASKHLIKGSMVVNYINAFAEEKKKLKEMVSDKSYFDQSFKIPISETFNRDAFAALLNVPGAKSIRAYYGKKPDGLLTLIFLPVDKDGNDIKTKILGGEHGSNTSSLNAQDGWDGVDNSCPCPYACCPPGFPGGGFVGNK